jgi:hypothetical protein
VLIDEIVVGVYAGSGFKFESLGLRLLALECLLKQE